MVLERILNLPLNHSYFLFGARGTGKSTLIENWKNEQLVKNLSPNSVLMVDLLDPAIEEKYTLKPGLLKEELEGSDYRWCIIDEVQKAPSLLDVAQWGITKKKINFAMTGSSARKLKRGGANLLAGRAFDLKLHPFSYRELGKNFSLDKVLRYGSLPEIFSLDNSLDKERYLTSYTRTYLKEEIQVEQIVRDVQKFRRFLAFASQMNTKVLSYTTLSDKSGVDPKSIGRYFEILEDTLLGYFLEPYDKSVRSRQKLKPKFYLFDTGVACQLREDFSGALKPSTSIYGELFEQWFVLECLKLRDYYEVNENFYYLATKDEAEIDLIVERRGQLPILIEIKSSDKISDRHLRHLNSFVKDIKHSRAIVACNEQVPRKTSNGIEILPWKLVLDELYPF